MRLLFLSIVACASFSVQAQIAYETLLAADGSRVQVCTRYPDPEVFPGPRPALFFIQGSGRYDTCKRLAGEWATEIVSRGVIIYGRQKRGVFVNPTSDEVQIDDSLFVTNDLFTLQSDSVLAFEYLLNQPLVDSDKLAVAGGSEGVWMTLAIAEKYPTLREVTLISGALERFDVLFERQISTLIPTEVIEALDQNKDGVLSSVELTSDILSDSGLRSFDEIDQDGNSFVDLGEAASEIRRAFLYSLAANDNQFLLSSFGGGLSTAWIHSAFTIDPLAARIAALRLTTHIHHGRDDVNASVVPVLNLEQQLMESGRDNFAFSYYDLGHALSRDVLLEILYGIADRLASLERN